MKTVKSDTVARERVEDTIVAVEIFHETLRGMEVRSVVRTVRREGAARRILRKHRVRKGLPV